MPLILHHLEQLPSLWTITKIVLLLEELSRSGVLRFF
jgi:hypothetical protein